MCKIIGRNRSSIGHTPFQNGGRWCRHACRLRCCPRALARRVGHAAAMCCDLFGYAAPFSHAQWSLLQDLNGMRDASSHPSAVCSAALHGWQARLVLHSLTRCSSSHGAPGTVTAIEGQLLLTCSGCRSVTRSPWLSSARSPCRTPPLHQNWDGLLGRPAAEFRKALSPRELVFG